MHIEIEFFGDTTMIAEQYISILDPLQEWSEINEVNYQTDFVDNILRIVLPTRDDYSLWVMTWRGAYLLRVEGYESFVSTIGIPEEQD